MDPFQKTELRDEDLKREKVGRDSDPKSYKERERTCCGCGVSAVRSVGSKTYSNVLQQQHKSNH